MNSAVENPGAKNTTTTNNVDITKGLSAIDYNKILVAGEGFGRDFIKGEIERLIRVL